LVVRWCLDSLRQGARAEGGFFTLNKIIYHEDKSIFRPFLPLQKEAGSGSFPPLTPKRSTIQQKTTNIDLQINIIFLQIKTKNGNKQSTASAWKKSDKTRAKAKISASHLFFNILLTIKQKLY
jgi:hypothetical protein